MTHTVKTLANKQIVLVTIGEILTLQDWEDVSLQIADALKMTDSGVHVIIDMTYTKRHPMNAVEIMRVTGWAKKPIAISVSVRTF